MAEGKISKPEEASTSKFYLLFDDITDETAKGAVEWILNANYDDTRPTSLNLIINSCGGSLSSAFAIIDTMRGSKIPVTTTGLGEISSAGLMVFFAGHKGSRTLTPNTAIMSHQFSSAAVGKAYELFNEQRNLNLISERIFRHYKTCTGLGKKQIEKYLLPQHDVYLTAQEALELKLCDKIALLDK